jgi:hypothetical protein
MHFTPLEGIVQLRPSFNYLDSIDEKTKAAAKRVEDEERPPVVDESFVSVQVTSTFFYTFPLTELIWGIT